MRCAIGAEFPERRAISIRARSVQAWKFTRANMRGVVIAVNVARDHVKKLPLSGHGGAAAYPRRKRRAQGQQIVNLIVLRRVEQELDAKPKQFGGVSAVNSSQRERDPLAIKQCTKRQLQLKSVQLQNHDALG